MRIFFDGIDRDEETELSMLDQRSCGGASGEDERESRFMTVESLSESLPVRLYLSVTPHHGRRRCNAKA
jgi:hypothetical protein